MNIIIKNHRYDPLTVMTAIILTTWIPDVILSHKHAHMLNGYFSDLEMCIFLFNR